MTPLAAELNQRGILGGYITAGWPSGWQKWIAQRFPKSGGWQRFLDRYEPIADALVHSQPAVEILLKIGDVLIRKISQRAQQHLHRLAFHIYSTDCIDVLSTVRPTIYHFRNCYGMKSVLHAKQVGAITLCDHSIAHPVCLSWMESNRGAWPKSIQFDEIRRKMLPLYRQMEADLLHTDHVLVNSDFVKNTCVYMGMLPKQIHVVYQGLDEAFFQFVKKFESSKKRSPESLLFAGGWQRRKGVDDLSKALLALNQPWSLDIAGGFEQETLSFPQMAEFLNNSHVNRMGILPRVKLAELMSQHRIFIFPSYCEGSARVIFEAMAAGCYVITTNNSGSIVQDGVHGRVVPVGDVNALTSAIAEAINNPTWVDEVGAFNKHTIAQEYRQQDYANRVISVYREITPQSIE